MSTDLISNDNNNYITDDYYNFSSRFNRMADHGSESTISAQMLLCLPRELVKNENDYVSDMLESDGRPSKMMTDGRPSKLTTDGRPNKLTTDGGTNKLTTDGRPSKLTTEGECNKLTTKDRTSKLMTEGGTSKLMTDGSTSTLMTEGGTSKLATEDRSSTPESKGRTRQVAIIGKDNAFILAHESACIVKCKKLIHFSICYFSSWQGHLYEHKIKFVDIVLYQNTIIVLNDYKIETDDCELITDILAGLYLDLFCKFVGITPVRSMILEYLGFCQHIRFNESKMCKGVAINLNSYEVSCCLADTRSFVAIKPRLKSDPELYSVFSQVLCPTSGQVLSSIDVVTADEKLGYPDQRSSASPIPVIYCKSDGKLQSSWNCTIYDISSTSYNDDHKKEYKNFLSGRSERMEFIREFNKSYFLYLKECEKIFEGHCRQIMAQEHFLTGNLN